jgi:beta-glucanase (GH16 family)
VTTPTTSGFDDEFDGPAGSPPNSQLWRIETGKEVWGGNGQLETNTASPDNVSLDGKGHLVITARRAAGANQYTSGRIVGLLPLPTYGHFVARIKMPTGDGFWPSFWLIGVDPYGATWPYGGEIDIAEMRTDQPSVQYATAHGGRVTPGPYTRVSPSVGVDLHWYNTRLLRYDKPISDAFHTFALDTSPGKLVWSFDSVPYMTLTSGMVPPGGIWPFDAVHYFMILNLAVGGDFSGNPTPSTPFPASMVIDYVRVTSSS